MSGRRGQTDRAPVGERVVRVTRRPTSWWGHGLTPMRAVQMTRFGGPEVLDVVDLPDPTPAEGQELFEVSAAGVNYADTHHHLS